MRQIRFKEEQIVKILEEGRAGAQTVEELPKARDPQPDVVRVEEEVQRPVG